MESGGDVEFEGRLRLEKLRLIEEISSRAVQKECLEPLSTTDKKHFDSSTVPQRDPKPSTLKPKAKRGSLGETPVGIDIAVSLAVELTRPIWPWSQNGYGNCWALEPFLEN